MTHPLTDDVVIRYFGLKQIGSICEKGREHVFVTQAMRTAADWQLEQVIEWLNETIFERGSSLEAVNIPEDLKQAMRPTTTQEDN